MHWRQSQLGLSSKFQLSKTFIVRLALKINTDDDDEEDDDDDDDIASKDRDSFHVRRICLG